MMTTSRRIATCWLSLVTLALACGDSGAEDDGAGGTGSSVSNGNASSPSSTSPASTTSAQTTTTGMEATAQSSTSSGQPATCPEPDITVVYGSGQNGAAEACKAVSSIDEALYEAEDDAGYGEAFEKLAAREATTVSFLFRTAFNSGAGYLITSHGDGSASVSTWRSCDKAPIDIVTEGAQLAEPGALTACATAATVPERIACMHQAFVLDGSSPACIVPGGHVGPP